MEAEQKREKNKKKLYQKNPKKPSPGRMAQTPLADTGDSMG